jgi:hypothetical protein
MVTNFIGKCDVIRTLLDSAVMMPSRHLQMHENTGKRLEIKMLATARVVAKRTTPPLCGLPQEQQENTVWAELLRAAGVYCIFGGPTFARALVECKCKGDDYGGAVGIGFEEPLADCIRGRSDQDGMAAQSLDRGNFARR